LDGAKVSTGSRSIGQGGDLTINASELVEVRGETRDARNGSDLFAQTSGIGKAGNLTINTRQLLVLDGAQISASTFGRGDGGILTINAPELVQVVGTLSKLSGTAGSGIFAQNNAGASGNAGELTINTRDLLVKDGAQIATGTFGSGNGGRLTVNAFESVQVIGDASDDSNLITSGIFTQVSNFNATGNAGELTINTRRLLVGDGATVSTATLAQGNGGALTVNASESVQLIGVSSNGGFASDLTTETFGKGDAGNLTINTGRLLIQDGASASARTYGKGDGGTLTVNATESVQVIGTSSSIYGKERSSLSTATANSGSAGDLLVSTPSLIVRDGARLSADTIKDGAGGNITVTANTVDVTSGGQLRTITAGSKDAGNITLLVQDKVFLAGTDSGLLANTTEGSTGNGGSIFIDPRTVIVRDRAQIAVGSRGTGEGGNIDIRAGSLILENEARLLAETASNTGGNITLKLEDLLLLRNNSKISTTAGTARSGGDGGNITIDADFIVGVPRENSDITANAFQGQGGNINITTQGIYGLKFRPRLTPLSDITASSEFGLDGEFQLDLLTDVDPSRGLAQLPTNVVDASDRIDRRCAPIPETQQRNSFTITGRGGLPLGPNDPLQNESIITNWVTLDSEVETKTAPTSTIPQSSTPRKLVEAQGWIINHKGEVVFTASALTATPHGEWFPEAKCDETSVESQ
jgi:large exoprotein involved in heme utilization and adhesion